MVRVRYIELLISTFLLYSLTSQALWGGFLHVFFLFFCFLISRRRLQIKPILLLPLSKGRSQWKGDGIIIKDEVAMTYAWILFSPSIIFNPFTISFVCRSPTAS